MAEPNADSKARRLANERAIQRSIDASYAESERLRRNAIVASAIGVVVIAVVVGTGGSAGALLPDLAFYQKAIGLMRILIERRTQ